MLTIAILLVLWVALLSEPDNVFLQGAFFSVAVAGTASWLL